MATKKVFEDEWLKEMSGLNGPVWTNENKLGVEIHARLIIDAEDGWEDLRDLMERLREVGAAEVVRYVIFAESK